MFLFVGFFCVCLPRKFMGLKVKVCFVGDLGLLEIWLCWRYGSGVWLRFGFGVGFFAGDWLRGRTRKNKITKAIKIK